MYNQQLSIINYIVAIRLRFFGGTLHTRMHPTHDQLCARIIAILAHLVHFAELVYSYYKLAIHAYTIVMQHVLTVGDLAVATVSK